MTDAEKKVLDDLAAQFKAGLEEVRGQIQKSGDVQTSYAKLQTELADIKAAMEVLRAAKVHVTQGKVIGSDSPAELKRQMGMWFRANVLHQKKAAQDFAAEFKTLSETTEGTDLVPVEFVAEIQRIALQMAQVRPRARMFPIGKTMKDVPTGTGTVTLTWTGETVASTETTPTTGKVALTVKKLDGHTFISNEMLEDTDIDLGGYLFELYAEAFAGEEDKQALVGTGSPFTGVLSVAGTNTVYLGDSSTSGMTAFKNLVADDLSLMIDAVAESSASDASYWLHRQIMHYVRTLKDDNNTPIYMSPATPGEPGTIYGYPVVKSDQLPNRASSAVDKAFIAFGSGKKIWMADRRQMSMKANESVKYLEDLMTFKGSERIAIAVGLPAGFAVLKTAAS